MPDEIFMKNFLSYSKSSLVPKFITEPTSNEVNEKVLGVR